MTKGATVHRGSRTAKPPRFSDLAAMNPPAGLRLAAPSDLPREESMK